MARVPRSNFRFAIFYAGIARLDRPMELGCWPKNAVPAKFRKPPPSVPRRVRNRKKQRKAQFCLYLDGSLDGLIEEQFDEKGQADAPKDASSQQLCHQFGQLRIVSDRRRGGLHDIYVRNL